MWDEALTSENWAEMELLFAVFDFEARGITIKIACDIFSTNVKKAFSRFAIRLY